MQRLPNVFDAGQYCLQMFSVCWGSIFVFRLFIYPSKLGASRCQTATSQSSSLAYSKLSGSLEPSNSWRIGESSMQTNTICKKYWRTFRQFSEHEFTNWKKLKRVQQG